MTESVKKAVAACESQPVTAVGLRCLINRCPDLEFVGVADSLSGVLPFLRDHPARVLILDKSFGTQAILETLDGLRSAQPATATVVWGLSVTEEEALRLLHAGARGVARRSVQPETLLEGLREVAEGATWLEPKVPPDRGRTARPGAPALTARERQVLELVAQGLKNREIAAELRIRPGTVKVHLKHIFEKTGVRGRFGLALANLEPPGRPSQ